MKKILVLVLGLGGLLFVTNPSMENFQSFVRTRAADRVEQELGGGALSDALGGAGAEVLAAHVPDVTRRRSYLVCSTYAVDLDRDGRPNGRVLGIAGQFLVIDDFSGDD